MPAGYTKKKFLPFHAVDCHFLINDTRKRWYKAGKKMAKRDIGGTGQKTPVLQMKQFLNDPLAKRYVLLQKYC